MTLADANLYAQRTANRTGSSVIVFRCTHKITDTPSYGFDFTLPTWGERIGERIYPNGFDDADVVYTRTASEQRDINTTLECEGL